MKKRMTIAKAHKLMGTKTAKELADKLGTKRQNVEYWTANGLPHWWAWAIEARVRQQA
jgi:hypothetical protein